MAPYHPFLLKTHLRSASNLTCNPHLRFFNKIPNPSWQLIPGLSRHRRFQFLIESFQIPENSWKFYCVFRQEAVVWVGGGQLINPKSHSINCWIKLPLPKARRRPRLNNLDDLATSLWWRKTVTAGQGRRARNKMKAKDICENQKMNMR